MIVYFCRGHDWIANAIKLATFGEFSHCAVSIGNDVYESTFEGGVSKTTIEEFTIRYPDRESIYVDQSGDVEAKKWLEQQIGKSYDYLALTAFPFRGKWHNDKQWFCSELIAAAMMEAGVLKLGVVPSRITPRDLWFSSKMRWKL